MNQPFPHRYEGKVCKKKEKIRSIGTIRDQTLIQDPNTEEKFEVPAGSNYFWRIGSGNEFVGTKTSDPVYLPTHWIQKMNVVD